MAERTEQQVSDKIKLNEEILEQLQQLSAGKDISIGRLSKLIAKEPVLGAKVIKFASERSSSDVPVATIAQAVMKLGVDTLCQAYAELLRKERVDS